MSSLPPPPSPLPDLIKEKGSAEVRRRWKRLFDVLALFYLLSGEKSEEDRPPSRRRLLQSDNPDREVLNFKRR